jgi:hypothetical protein
MIIASLANMCANCGDRYNNTFSRQYSYTIREKGSEILVGGIIVVKLITIYDFSERTRSLTHAPAARIRGRARATRLSIQLILTAH